MLNDLRYDAFLKALSDKYPKRNQLVDTLMHLLHIEREAVYRRLRKDVQFTVSEVAQIATAWHISIDDILGLNAKEFRFKMRLIDYIHPKNEDLLTIQSQLQNFEKVQDTLDFAYMEVSNRLPRILVIDFPLVRKLSLLRWVYYSGTSPLPFSKTDYNEEAFKYLTAYYQAIKKIPQITFVVDARAMNYLIEDIRYFHSISLISDEEKELLKKELYTIIDYGSTVATKGSWPETGNKVDLYISQLNIEASYNYSYYNGETQLCSIQSFERGEIYSDEKVIIDKVRAMMHAKKQSSVLISGANEQERIAYFRKQREVLDSL